MIGCRSFSALSMRALRSAGIFNSVACRGLPGTPCCCNRLILPPATWTVSTILAWFGSVPTACTAPPFSSGAAQLASAQLPPLKRATMSALPFWFTLSDWKPTSSVNRSAANWPDLVLARNLATVSVCADMRSPLIDETGNELHGEIGIVEIGEMAGAGNHRDRGPAGDLVAEMLSVGRRQDFILVAPHDQRVGAHAMQSAHQPRIAERPQD